MEITNDKVRLYNTIDTFFNEWIAKTGRNPELKREIEEIYAITHALPTTGKQSDKFSCFAGGFFAGVDMALAFKEMKKERATEQPEQVLLQTTERSEP